MSEPAPKKRARPKPDLTLREVRFAEHFVEHGNASEAYRAAGYAERPATSTWVLAFRVLRNIRVQQLIRTLRQEAIDATRVSVNRLVQALARIAFANRGDLFDEEGRVLPPSRWPADIAAAVEGVESEELYETVSEFDDAAKKTVRRKVLVGHVRKVKTARRTEAIRILAQWKRMIGLDAELEQMGREIDRLRALITQLKEQGDGDTNPGP